jgi:hypothetical protein
VTVGDDEGRLGRVDADRGQLLITQALAGSSLRLYVAVGGAPGDVTLGDDEGRLGRVDADRGQLLAVECGGLREVTTVVVPSASMTAVGSLVDSRAAIVAPHRPPSPARRDEVRTCWIGDDG